MTQPAVRRDAGHDLRPPFINAMAGGDVDAEHVRILQLANVTRFSPAMLAVNAACSVLVTALLWRDTGVWLIFWCASLLLLSWSRVRLLNRAMRFPDHPFNRRSLRLSIVEAAFAAALLIGALAWILAYASGLTLTIVVCMLTGILWGGSIVFA
ncbi:MAG: hypothetical protein ACRYHQ_04370, partial [Janthinobacterium lividum]